MTSRYSTPTSNNALESDACGPALRAYARAPQRERRAVRAKLGISRRVSGRDRSDEH